MRRFFVWVVMALFVLPVSVSAAPLEISAKNNETVPLGAVYWISNCRSILKSFAGVDKLEGPPEVKLSLKEGMVHAVRQNCSAPIKGATLMLTASGVTKPVTATLVVRVRYNTRDGERQSTHTFALSLFP